MGKLIKFLLIALLLGLVGLVIYAFVADLNPKARDVELPITLPLE